MVVSALILVLGIDLVKEALWDTRHRVSRLALTHWYDMQQLINTFQDGVYYDSQHYGYDDSLGFCHRGFVWHCRQL
jgi:hypothetical protein